MWVAVVSLLAAMIAVLLWQSPAPAQFGLSDFRLNQLSSEVAALRLQVGQLQAQIGGSRTVAPASPTPRIAQTPRLPISPDQFDRLATLVIETREDVRALDDRLKAIEARLPQTTPQRSTPASPPASPPVSPR